MIIRLGLLDEDERYTSRLAAYLGSHADEGTQFELFLFSETADYNAFMKNGGRLDILLATAAAMRDPEEIRSRLVFAYLSEDMSIVSYNEIDAICKYQRASDILRAIQGLAAQINKGNIKYSLGDKGRVILFAGAAGGMGCTTAAIGCAARLAQQGRKAIYLSFQQSWLPDDYFNTYGSSLSDVHYAYQEWLREGSGSETDEADKHRLQLRLKSMLARDSATRVESYGCFTLPADGLDIFTEELTGQIEALASQCDDCIVDLDGRLDESFLSVMRISSWAIFVTDGTPKGNSCTNRLLQSLKAISDSGEPLLNRDIGVLYSRFGSKARTDEELPKFVRVLGKIPRYEGASARAIVQDLAKCEVYRILESRGEVNDVRAME